MTNQELFEKVAQHLLTQQRRASFGGTCWYYAKGLRCAVGCLFPEEINTTPFEGVSLRELVDTTRESSSQKPKLKLLAKALQEAGVKEEQYQLLRHLQQIHDDTSVEFWREHLITLSKEYQLKFPESL